jgi:anti-sigma regulatory factor (Ser/Thr protein kinase)
MLDAAETLERLSIAGRPDRGRFNDQIGVAIRDASRHASPAAPVHAYGEMVTLLWDAGQVNAALELEGLWNELGTIARFTLVCAYPVSGFAGDPDGFRDVCHTHSGVAGVAHNDEAGRSEAQSFPCHKESAADARHFVVDLLRRWGLSGLSDHGALAVTELSANAILHAKTPFTVTVALRPGAVRIAVADGDRTLPTVRTVSPLASTGRGLTIVAGVAAAVGSDQEANGKTVWADLRPLPTLPGTPSDRVA